MTLLVSAGTSPRYGRLFDANRAHPIRAVIWRLDRLGRSMEHLIEVVGEFERCGVHLRSPHETIDTTTATGPALDDKSLACWLTRSMP
jgi:DNA invertase Pin-like site-specific DNA recombinase